MVQRVYSILVVTVMTNINSFLRLYCKTYHFRSTYPGKGGYMSRKRKASCELPRKRGKPSQYAPVPSATNKRCWSPKSTSMEQYHDDTWGRPEISTSRLFESQTLQLMQCGLTWKLVWSRREHLKKAFRYYKYTEVAKYTKDDVDKLMQWPDQTIIRHRGKLEAVVNNAKQIVKMESAAALGKGLSFADLLWSFCPRNDKERLKSAFSITGNHMRSKTVSTGSYASREVSDGVHPTMAVCRLSHELKVKYRFKFMGPTVVLSFMQAIGLMNHHSNDCFVFQRNEEEIAALRNHLSQGKSVQDWKSQR